MTQCLKPLPDPLDCQKEPSRFSMLPASPRLEEELCTRSATAGSLEPGWGRGGGRERAWGWRGGAVHSQHSHRLIDGGGVRCTHSVATG